MYNMSNLFYWELPPPYLKFWYSIWTCHFYRNMQQNIILSWRNILQKSDKITFCSHLLYRPIWVINNVTLNAYFKALSWQSSDETVEKSQNNFRRRAAPGWDELQTSQMWAAFLLLSQLNGELRAVCLEHCKARHTSSTWLHRFTLI